MYLISTSQNHHSHSKFDAHLAIARTDGKTSSSFNLCDRNIRAWAGRPSASAFGSTSYRSLVKTESPTSEILLKVCVQYFSASLNLSTSSVSQPETKWSTWDRDPEYDKDRVPNEDDWAETVVKRFRREYVRETIDRKFIIPHLLALSLKLKCLLILIYCTQYGDVERNRIV